MSPSKPIGHDCTKSPAGSCTNRTEDDCETSLAAGGIERGVERAELGLRLRVATVVRIREQQDRQIVRDFPSRQPLRQVPNPLDPRSSRLVMVDQSYDVPPIERETEAAFYRPVRGAAARRRR